MGSGKGESVLVHVGINNVEREGTTVIIEEIQAVLSEHKADAGLSR